MGISRRRFVKATAALPVLGLPACGPTGGSDDATSSADPRRLDPAALRAVGAAVLPAALGADGIERAVVGFETWIAGYSPAAERDHGYGTAEIRYTGPDPAPGWKAQLEAWDLEVRKRYGAPLAGLDAANLDAFIRDQLRDEPRLTDPAQAHNVALALLSWWTSSSAAADFCHGVAIGRDTCRPLADVTAEPSPLPERTT